MTEIQQHLWECRDMPYKAFQSPLLPTVKAESIIGVRVPVLRKYAKELEKSELREPFLRELPHRYLEEYLLHVLLLSSEHDFAALIAETERVLPYIDNWAVCDSFSPRLFRSHRAELLPHIERWLSSEREFTLRFGIKMLMDHYLEDVFSPAYPELVAAVRSDAYYVRMMVAWYFATALAKRYDAVLPFLRERRLDSWTHNKTIQKAVESFRVTDEHKAELKTLRV